MNKPNGGATFFGHHHFLHLKDDSITCTISGCNTLKEGQINIKLCKYLAIRVKQLTQIILLSISRQVSDKGYFHLKINKKKIKIHLDVLKVRKLMIYINIDNEP